MSETAPPRRQSWLAGRSDRREYWAYVGVLFAIAVALSLIPNAPSLSGGGAAVMTIIQVRRFHDLGRTGWWAVAIVAAQLAIVVPAVLTAPLGVATLVGGAATLVPLVVLGALPGQPYQNRFGPPRGQRSLKDIFS